DSEARSVSLAPLAAGRGQAEQPSLLLRQICEACQLPPMPVHTLQQALNLIRVDLRHSQRRVRTAEVTVVRTRHPDCFSHFTCFLLPTASPRLHRPPARVDPDRPVADVSTA